MGDGDQRFTDSGIPVQVVYGPADLAGFGSAAETNARFRYLLEHGQTGLSVAFDLPTQMGYDSDHPMAAAEVGKVGVAIDSLPTCAGCSRASPWTGSRPR